LTPRKIIKIVAIKCQILRLRCTKFDFLQRSTRPLVGFKGTCFYGKGGGREGRKERRWREIMGRKRRKEREISGFFPEPTWQPTCNVFDVFVYG